ncbi:MAG: TonB-dependent receptor [Pseudomonadota bacterium]
MRLFCTALSAIALCALAMPVGAQEIVVTGSRARGGGYVDTSAPSPALALRRTADFAVLQVKVTGDTRDPAKRREEIYAMIRGAITLAQKSGVELATGETIVEPLTLANYQSLILSDDDRDDTQAAGFLVKSALSQGGDPKAALERIARFVRDVPSVGRAEIKTQGEMTLSVVNPEQYRNQIIALVAADATGSAGKFGENYRVQVQGLDRRIQWGRASLSEVYLYLPISYVIVPKD